MFAATCSSVTVLAARDLDGTYEEGPTTGDSFYRPGGTTFYEIYKFTSSDVPGWYIAVGNTVVYRVSEPWRFGVGGRPTAVASFEAPGMDASRSLVAATRAHVSLTAVRDLRRSDLWLG